MKSVLFSMIVLTLCHPAWAGESKFLVVAFSDRQHVAVVLRQQADYVSMPVSISSGQRDPLQRFAELRDAKAAVLRKAQGNPDIVIHSGRVTLSAKPVSKLASVVPYSSAESEADLHVLVPFKGKNRDVFACADIIRRFLNDLTLPSKTSMQLGSIQLAVDNPEQYRPTLVQMISEDVTRTKEKVKADAKVLLSGLESPVLVRQADDENVDLFIDYEFTIETK
ncbi:MAG: hypothetical protein ACOYXU_11460 [Nitrospirota bacterium]